MQLNHSKEKSNTKFIYQTETYKIIGACMAVHNELGAGFNECVYQDALEVELTRKGIPFKREFELPIIYKGVKLKSFYKADFVCYDKIILELKALDALNGIHVSQILNYLRISKLKIGYLINFGNSKLKYDRYVV